jgi:hypothetical protein
MYSGCPTLVGHLQSVMCHVFRLPNTSLIMRYSAMCHIFSLPNTSLVICYLSCVMYSGCPTLVGHLQSVMCHVFRLPNTSLIMRYAVMFHVTRGLPNTSLIMRYSSLHVLCIQVSQHQFDHVLFCHVSCIQDAVHQLIMCHSFHVSCLKVALYKSLVLCLDFITGSIMKHIYLCFHHTTLVTCFDMCLV